MKQPSPKKFKKPQSAATKSLEQAKKPTEDTPVVTTPPEAPVVPSPAPSAPVESPSTPPSAAVPSPVSPAPPETAKPDKVEVVEIPLEDKFSTQAADNVASAPLSSAEKPELSQAPEALTPKVPSSEQPPAPPVAAQVPSVKADAPLKIESEEEEKEEELPPIEKKNKKIYIVGIIAALLLIVVTGILGLYFLSSGSKKEEKTAKKEVSATPTQAPKAVLVRSEWSFEVLNGSGIAGEAKKASDALLSLGYKVDMTGNADNQNYEKTQLLLKKDASAENASLIIKDLTETFPSIEMADDFLEDEASATARIIIGND